MPSVVEGLFGVKLPIDALWDAIEEEFGYEALERLFKLHAKAGVRYSRALHLRKMRANLDRPGVPRNPLKSAYARYCLAHVDEYLDGTLETFIEWKKKLV